MVRHLVLWNLLSTLTEEEKEVAAQTIKTKLEAVKDQVDGILSLNVVISPLGSSNRDLALISEFISPAALDAYQTHPAHLEAANYVRSMTCNRTCLDYEIHS